MYILFCLMALSGASTEKIFTEIYSNKTWGTNSSGDGHSGGGSTLQATEDYRRFLQDFLYSHEISSVVDLGCGDWEFSQAIDWSTVNYLGIDVVKSLILKNQEKYGSQYVNFIHMPNSQNLPVADLLIIKDVLQHLSIIEIMKILKQLPKFKYALITNDVDPVTLSSPNHDTGIGGYRPLDLTVSPFSLKPIYSFTYKTNENTKMVLLISNP